MAIEMCNVMIYTVKYLDPNGVLKFQDIQALGTSDAKDKFTRDYPGCSIQNIVRKQ